MGDRRPAKREKRQPQIALSTRLGSSAARRSKLGIVDVIYSTRFVSFHFTNYTHNKNMKLDKEKIYFFRFFISTTHLWANRRLKQNAQIGIYEY